MLVFIPYQIRTQYKYWGMEITQKFSITIKEVIKC